MHSMEHAESENEITQYCEKNSGVVYFYRK